MSEQTQFPYRTRVICGAVTPKGNVRNDKNPLENHENIWLDPTKNLNFAVKKDVWSSIVDIDFFNIKNRLHLSQDFSVDLLKVVKEKGVYSSEYMDSFEKFCED